MRDEGDRVVKRTGLFQSRQHFFLFSEVEGKLLLKKTFKKKTSSSISRDKNK